MKWLEKQKEQKAEKTYEKHLASWQTEHDNLAACIELAKTFRGVPTDDIMLKAGEALFLQVTGVSLIEQRAGPGHWQGRSSGVSIPIGHIGRSAIRYHVGASKGYFVQGTPHDAAVDSGTLYVTNKRVIFAGSHQTRECAYDKLLSLQNDDTLGTSTFSVSNRQKPTTIHYGTTSAPAVVFRLTLALAHFKGTVPQLQKQLQATLETLESNKPQPPVTPQPLSSPQSPATAQPASSAAKSPKAAKPSKPKKKWIAGNKQIITLLIIFWPVGLFILWHNSTWSRRSKLIATGILVACFIAFCVWAVIVAPPSLAITSSFDDQQGAAYQLTGTVDPGDTVTINGKAVAVTNGNFSAPETLAKGDNDFDIVVHEGKKVTEQSIVIHRYTDAEVAAQQAAASHPSDSTPAPTPSTSMHASSTPTKTTPPPILTNLAFSGFVSGTASGNINLQKEITNATMDNGQPTDWTTQCIMAPDANSGAAWSANMTFTMNGNTWELQISNGNNFGNPSPGQHAAIDIQNNAGSNTGDLIVYVASKQPVTNGQMASDSGIYTYVTSGQKDITAAVTVNSGLTTGTVDLWETPFNGYPNQMFHITGTWNCNK